MLELNFKNEAFQPFYNKLEALAKRRVDIVRPSNNIFMEDQKLVLQLPTQSVATLRNKRGLELNPFYTLDPSEVMQEHLMDKIGITRTYGRRMLKDYQPAEGQQHLFDWNINKWLEQDARKDMKDRKKYFIRTYVNEDGSGLGRAFLSDRYNPIDNFTILQLATKAIMKAAKDGGIKMDVHSCSLTDKKMYVRFILPNLRHKITNLKNYKNPETLRQSEGGIISGFVLSNSEVGHGQISIAPSIFVDACSNGMVFFDEKWNRKHLGKKLEKGLINWSRSTEHHYDQALMSEIKDVIKTFASKDFAGKKVEEIERAATTMLNNPFPFVENLSTNFKLSDEEKGDVMNFFAKGGSTESVLDGVQAFTFLAQKLDKDRQMEIEEASVKAMRNFHKYDKPIADFQPAQVLIFFHSLIQLESLKAKAFRLFFSLKSIIMKTTEHKLHSIEGKLIKVLNALPVNSKSFNETLEHIRRVKNIYPPLRAVKITVESGDHFYSSMSYKLTDEEIYSYYEIGSKVNLGSVTDRMEIISEVKILH